MLYSVCQYFVDRCLTFCPFSFGHCIVCSPLIYDFWLSIGNTFDISKLVLLCSVCKVTCYVLSVNVTCNLLSVNIACYVLLVNVTCSILFVNVTCSVMFGNVTCYALFEHVTCYVLSVNVNYFVLFVNVTCYVVFVNINVIFCLSIFCRSLFDILSLFFWPLHCLFSFDLWLLIIHW